MQNTIEKQCLFCSEFIPYRIGVLRNLETHLRISHDISANKGFNLYILFLSQEERDEPRMKELRMEEEGEQEDFTELREDWEDKKLDEIQRSIFEQLMDSFDSEDDDD